LNPRYVRPKGEGGCAVRKIFINYRRDDRASIALNIAQYLERVFGADSIFLDIDRLRAGEQFPLVLEKRLSECRVMLAIIGPGWFNASDEAGRRRLEEPDDWVRLEIARALARNVRVVPVLVDGATLPKKNSLPEDIRSLVDRQSFTFTNRPHFATRSRASCATSGE
jgi:TIR domain